MCRKLMKLVNFTAGKKGQYVWTNGKDMEAIARGIYNTYTKKNLRYSQACYV